MAEIKAQVISGEVGKILARQKSKEEIELGELLIAENHTNPEEKMLLQAYGLGYGSQISQQNIELVSGLELEDNVSSEMIDAELRNYKLVMLKNILTIKNNKPATPKTLPNFLSKIREIKKDDLLFLTKPKNPLYFGKLRSGSKTLDVDIFLDGEKALTHHVLIPALTGKGKSNLTSCMLWDSIGKDYCGMLVLDPHDEYYGRNNLGLKDHEKKERIVYYTTNPPAGARSLKINLEMLKPSFFNGVVDWSMPQKEALEAYYKKYGKEWIEAVILEKPLDDSASIKSRMFSEGTIGVIRRRIFNLLNLEFSSNTLHCNGVFDLNAGLTTIKDIVDELEKSAVVIVDTSSFSGAVEILIGSIIATEILNRYRNYKMKGMINDKPIISIILEEAPRVLGKEVLEKGSNIFSTIAREGRKFKVGLVAITQLPSLIPREILANMNTKIILGIEMAPERQAVIDSASQDLSDDSRSIASLDKGEAVITSNFSPFAVPIKIPFFEEIVKKDVESRKKFQMNFNGVNLG